MGSKGICVSEVGRVITRDSKTHSRPRVIGAVSEGCGGPSDQPRPYVRVSSKIKCQISEASHEIHEAVSPRHADPALSNQAITTRTTAQTVATQRSSADLVTCSKACIRKRPGLSRLACCRGPSTDQKRLLAGHCTPTGRLYIGPTAADRGSQSSAARTRLPAVGPATNSFSQSIGNSWQLNNASWGCPQPATAHPRLENQFMDVQLTFGWTTLPLVGRGNRKHKAPPSLELKCKVRC